MRLKKGIDLEKLRQAQEEDFEIQLRESDDGVMAYFICSR